MIEKNHSYCCICGKEILRTVETEIKEVNDWEKYRCPTHTHEETEKYRYHETPGYCSVCGIIFYEDEPDCEHSNIKNK